jgi:hypothetical protein
MINILFYIKLNNESCCLNFPELIIDEYKNIFELLNHIKTLDVFSKKIKWKIFLYSYQFFHL